MSEQIHYFTLFVDVWDEDSEDWFSQGFADHLNAETEIQDAIVMAEEAGHVTSRMDIVSWNQYNEMIDSIPADDWLDKHSYTKRKSE